jgi:hypothetical protein
VIVLLAFTDGPRTRDRRNGKTESGAEGSKGAQRQSSFPTIAHECSSREITNVRTCRRRVEYQTKDRRVTGSQFIVPDCVSWQIPAEQSRPWRFGVAARLGKVQRSGLGRPICSLHPTRSFGASHFAYWTSPRCRSPKKRHRGISLPKLLI